MVDEKDQVTKMFGFPMGSWGRGGVTPKLECGCARPTLGQAGTEGCWENLTARSTLIG